MRKFEFRPWGWFITLDEGVNYKVKKIHLNPNTKLSLQYHHYRDEHWTVVEGSGKAIVNKNVFNLCYFQNHTFRKDPHTPFTIFSKLLTSKTNAFRRISKSGHR